MLNIFKRNNEEEQSAGPELKVDFFEKEQWKSLLSKSNEESVFIFKHSTRCGVSSMIFKRFKKQMNQRNQKYYFLNILANRELSNWISDELNIRHESPQLIVLKDEKVIAYDSHYNLLDISESILS